jgi:hypothetical protein
MEGRRIMAKLMALLGALLLVGSLGAAPVDGDVRREPLSASGPLGGEAHASAALEEVAAAQAKSDSTGTGRIGEMSEEEKERRREACMRENQVCCDECRRNKWGQSCYKECSEKLGRCMKPIPY